MNDPTVLAASGAGSGLQAKDIARSYKGVKALDGVGIAVPRGQVTGLIGANGAGKSTLVNILSGYDRPESGSVGIDGRDITAESAVRRARRGIARTFQHGHLYPRLSVLENVEVAAMACGARPAAARRRAAGLLGRLGLLDWAENSSDRLPHGVERRLGVARALAIEPSFVLFDEPAAGLNDGEAEQFRDIMRSLAVDEGIGVLLIDHNIPLIFASCDHIFVLGTGTNVAEGTPEQVRADDRVASTYLGTVAAGSGDD